MIKKIVELAYEKASLGVNNKNKTNIAKHIASSLDNKNSISFKSIIRLYDKYILNKDNISKPSENTVDTICNYLGYKNYSEFVSQYDSKNNKAIVKDRKSQKIIKVEVTNLGEVLLKNKKSNYKLFVFMGIVISSIILYQLFKPNKITINNFNSNKNYYYYTTPKGNIELTDNPSFYNAKPLTYQVLNTYLEEQKIDTTNKKIRLIKAQYFNKGWKDKPLDELVDDNKYSSQKGDTTYKKRVNIKVNKKKRIINSSKIIRTNKKMLLINVKNGDEADIEIENKLFDRFKNDYNINNSLESNFILNGKSNYTFKESSMTKDRIICTLTLSYSIIEKETNKVILNDNKQVKGTGFSIETAKQNTINKLKF